MADKNNTENRLWWIIGILLSIIFALISYSMHRETSRLDRQVTVIHSRINDLMRIKSDKEDVKREFDYVWKIMNTKDGK